MSVTQVTPTMPYQMVYLPQYIEETTQGTFPSTGTTTNIAPTAMFSLQSDKGAIPIFSVGSRDPQSILDGAHVSGFSLRFHPVNTTFMKYGYNLGSGSGTIDKTLSFATQLTIGGTNYFFTMVNCRVVTMQTIIAPGGPITCDAYVIGQTPAFAVSAPATGFTTLTGTPLSFYSGGANPVTWGSTNFNLTACAVAVHNNVHPVFIQGNQDYVANPPGGHDFNCVLSGLFSDPSKQMTDFVGYTSRTLTITLDSSGPKAFTLAASQLVSLRGVDFNISDYAGGRFGRGKGPVEEVYHVFSPSLVLS